MVYAFTVYIRLTGGVPEVLMAHADVDVAIIGAGPVGMALASELIRHGLTVRIVDKAASTKDYSRAPVFWPRAQEALDLMGIRPLWDGRTVPMKRIHINLYGRPAGAVAMDGGASAHPTPILAGQDVTEKILDDHLTSLGTPVERATEATAVVIREDGADVTIKPKGREAQTFAASWVVGCEGAPSVVRKSAGIGWEGHQLKGLMVPIADAKAKWPLINKVGDCHVALTDKGYLLTIPLPGVQRIIIAIPDDTPPGKQPETTLEQVATLMADAIGGPVELSDAPWVTVVRYGNFLADRLREGRALLAGDAAHSIAPLSGQGMNTGVQDAFDLGWKLAYVHKGWAPIGLLNSYDADRGPIAKHLAQTTDRFFRFVLDPTPAQKHLIKAVGSAALKVRKVRETISEFYTELSVAYPQSPLNDAHTHRAPKPGEHVLDGDLVRWPDLEPLRLYDLLRGLHWTVIAFTGADPQPQTLAATRRRLAMLVSGWDAKRLTASLVVQSPNPSDQGATSEVTTTLDAWGDLHGVYGASGGALLLIRPDGYVALHRPADDAGFAALDDLLRRTLQAAVVK